MLKCFFISRGHLTSVSHKGSNLAYGHSFSNQWAFTMLQTEVFKYNFLNFYIVKPCCIFVEICTVDVK